jgi:drug/metabolite transporter (DMT)-like permease
MNQSIRTTLLFALCCWIWGSTWLAIRFGLEGVPPFIGAGLRMASAGVFLVGVALVTRMPWPRSKMYLAYVIAQGASMFGIQYALVYWAEQTVPSGLVAVLFAVNPLLTSLVAALVFRIETFAPINILGLMTGFCGVALIYWSEVVTAAHAPAAGALAVLAASAIAAIATVVAKRYAHDLPPLAIVGPGQIVGGLVLGILAMLTERGDAVHFTAVSTIAFLYLTIFGSAIAFLSYFALVRTMSVTKLSLLTYITPVIAVLLGYFVAHEQLAPTTMVGAAIVFAGIGLVHVKAHAKVEASSISTDPHSNSAVIED